jgi:RNA polymerase sigma-70 factor, ECF subfamily
VTIIVSVEPSDLDLWQAAAAGDRIAFHALIDWHAPALLRVAISMSASRADAEDLCQETFLAAFRGMKNFQGRSSVKTWLTRILISKAATLWKKQRYARQTLPLHPVHADAGRSGGGGLTADEASVDSASESVDQRLDILDAIRTLSPEFRQTLVLREIDGLSYDEIATALSIPRGTVESRLYRARAELRRKLADYQPAPEMKVADSDQEQS